MTEWERRELMLAAGAGTAPNLRPVDATYAVSLTASLLIELESNKQKSYKDFLRSAGDLTTVLQYVSPLDHLTEFLKQAKLAINVGSIAAASSPNIRAASPPPFSSLFASMDIAREANAGVHTDAYVYVLQLAPFTKTRKSGSLREYLSDLGGMLNFRVDDPINRIQNLKVQLALSEVVQAVNDTEESILDFQRNTFEYAKAEFEQDFKQRLADLKLRADKAEWEARSIHKLANLISSFEKIAAGAASLYGNYMSGNYLAMSNTVAQMTQNVSDIDRAIRLEHDVAQLRKVYDEVVQDMNALIDRLNAIKADMFEKHNAKLDRILKARSEYNRTYQEALSYHEDLLRLALVNFIQRGDTIDHQFNMNMLQTLSTRYPAAALDLSRVSSLSKNCSGINPKPIREVLNAGPDEYPICAISEPDPNSKQWTELVVADGPFADLILFRYRPTAGPVKMELQGLFRGRQLRWQYVPE
ncbi:hypothetical protein MA20_07695 [Bradyrhizobium japonicum]|uniref:Uncharacterized protein n=2 Tax=Bradyrhizobium japonicum TaxID=375 RepID=A0A0A3Y4H0_BRAJP|nr:hypothetical protein MA20_07695 [Bradyrhizobium japonicum]